MNDKKKSSEKSRSASTGTLRLMGDIGPGRYQDHPMSGKKAHSIHGNAEMGYLTPIALGRKELFELVPMQAVFGLQKRERSLSMAFASYAADLDALGHEEEYSKLSKAEQMKRKSRASLMIMDEFEVDRSVVTTPLIFAVMVAALAQFLVGYNTGVMNAPSNVVFAGHSTVMWSVAVSAFAIGGPLGSKVAGNLADTRGRRGALLINMWTFLIGGLIQTFALDMFSIIVARLIIGFASGFSSVLVPIYLGELSPPTLRGMLGTLTQFALVIGILIADLFAFPFATESKWRVLFAITPLTAAFQLLCAPILLESPRWLLNRDPNSRRARFIIKKLRGLHYDYEIDMEADNYISASKIQSMEPSTVGESPVMQMLHDKKVRLLVVSAIFLQMGQQLCGINAVFYYSTSFFNGIIDNPLVGTTIVGFVNVLATYAALLLMDNCGRRTLILYSSGGMFLSCIMIVLSLLGVFKNIVALFAVVAYVSFFEIGLGPIPWLIVAEMFDAKYVSTAMSLSSQVNWTCNFIVGIGFPYLDMYLGVYSFVPFATVLAIVFFYSLVWLPETYGTTPEELQAKLVKNMIRSSSSASVFNVDNPESAGNNETMESQWRKAMNQIRDEESQAMKDGTYDYGFQPINSK